MRVLVAGVGNVLRSDDGFGVEVVRRLELLELPEQVRVVETGIGGMALLQELRDGVELLIVIDAVDHGRLPGTVMVIEPEVLDVQVLSPIERYDTLADIHLATPERVFVMAKALGVLPRKVMVVGCQPEDATTMGQRISPPVLAAIDRAIGEVLTLVGEFLGGLIACEPLRNGT